MQKGRVYIFPIPGKIVSDVKLPVIVQEFLIKNRHFIGIEGGFATLPSQSVFNELLFLFKEFRVVLSPKCVIPFMDTLTFGHKPFLELRCVFRKMVFVSS